MKRSPFLHCKHGGGRTEHAPSRKISSVFLLLVLSFIGLSGIEWGSDRVRLTLMAKPYSESNHALVDGNRSFVDSSRKVLLCGYDLTYFAKLLYPNATFISVRERTLENDKLVFRASEGDLLLDTFNGPCYYRSSMFEKFPGNIIYLNGEPLYLAEDWKLNRCNRFYLGPTKREVLPYRRATYYAQFAMMIPKYRELGAHLRASTPRPKRFLVYRSSNCAPHREKAFDTILRTVEQNLRKTDIGEAAGRCFGTRKDARIEMNRVGWNDIDDLKGNYRFALTMERVKTTGYVSEKIVIGFTIGAIPIYYGSEEVFKLFNREAFIYYNVSSPKQALDEILYLERNTTAYLEMRAKPALAVNANRRFFSYFSETPGKGDGYLAKLLRKDLEDSCKQNPFIYRTG